MRRLAVALALAALAATAPSAGAVTFGADLSRTPDVTTTCGDFNALFPQYDPRMFDSCSLTFQNLRTGETVFPPAGQGVVTEVRVRVGPNTGPMQVVVEQALRKDNPGDPGHPTYACCQAIRVSQQFTPTPNAVTRVPVNLPVRQDLAPDPQTGYYVDQHLALSVLARTVPIPAASDQNTFYSVWFPAWRAGDERVGPYNGSGAIVLFNAEWQPAGGGGTGGGGGATPGIDFGRVRALGDGTARLPITLPGPGLLGITDDRAAAAAKRKPKARVKRIRRNIKKAGRVTVRIRPSKTGKRTLRRKRKLRVKLRITFTPSGAKSSAILTKSVTLKLKRKRRR